MRVSEFAVGLSSPLRTAHGEIDEREGFLVGVDGCGDSDDCVNSDNADETDADETDTDETDADVSPRTPAVGIGEATPLPGWTESLTACEAALDGEGDGTPTPDDIDPRETPAARHGVALAFDDAAARASGRSLAARLAERAGFPEPAESVPAGSIPSNSGQPKSVPVNATIGDSSRTETVGAAERAVDDGYECIKVKVGARTVDADVSRLRGVRETVGPAVELRADANGAWDRETARRALNRLADLDLAYVEQPLPADDLAGASRLRAETAVPIALDESLAAHSIEAVLAADAADAVVLKPMALGGPDRAVDAAKQAREAGVEPVITTTIDAVVARTAAVHVAGAVPNIAACGLATGGLLAADLAADPCPVSDGRIAVPEGPGIAGDAFEDLL